MQINRFRNISIKRLSGKLFFALIFLVVMLAINGLATFFLLERFHDNNNVERERQIQLARLQTLELQMSQQAEYMSVYVKPGQGGLREVILKLSTNIEYYLGQVINEFNEAGLQERLSSLRVIYRQVQADYGRVLNPQLVSGEAAEIFNDTQGLRSQFFEELETFIADRQLALDDIHNLLNREVETVMYLALLVLIASLIIALVLSFMVLRLFSRPVSELNNKLNRMADGDLTPGFDIKGSEEMLELGNTLNRAVARLRLVIARIQLQANTVADTSRYLEEASTSQANGLALEAVAVSEVSATVGELSGTSQQIALSAQQVATSAGEALHSAEIGYSTMRNLSHNMAEIIHRVNQIADRIMALNAVAQRIREATALISIISDDTHLLALNAAIESAGAGEEGARFAVVAGQVRKLAQRSRLAAVEIQQLVSQIQHATTASVMATEEGMKVASVGQEMVEETLRANEEIIGLVQQTTQLASAISLATDQQRQASSQMAETMQELADMISGISQNSKNYLASANALTEVAHQLNYLLRTFRISAASDISTSLNGIKKAPNGLKPNGAVSNGEKKLTV
jgi:methyl-accepting chemotaxis protein